ncbi:hypothetical protein CJ030_MR8G028139 [Morella rubra]|uniref:Uncharacterized protein n=1 Tax=Morella rubra TaxID=262757 RepID=A0A6A1UVM6_9ROSI|nr:hypothetical protein CJ030_MR8G028139 [Morella rubra]
MRRERLSFTILSMWCESTYPLPMSRKVCEENVLGEFRELEIWIERDGLLSWTVKIQRVI